MLAIIQKGKVPFWITHNTNSLYNRIINNNDCIDCDIKLYKLIIYNLEKKAELKELLKDYCNEETVKLILTELYEKKINQLLFIN
jgi:hypothetical protein